MSEMIEAHTSVQVRPLNDSGKFWNTGSLKLEILAKNDFGYHVDFITISGVRAIVDGLNESSDLMVLYGEMFFQICNTPFIYDSFKDGNRKIVNFSFIKRHKRSPNEVSPLFFAQVKIMENFQNLLEVHKQHENKSLGQFRDENEIIELFSLFL